MSRIYKLVPRGYKPCHNKDLEDAYEAMFEIARDKGWFTEVANPNLYLMQSTRSWGKQRRYNGHMVVALNEVFLKDTRKAWGTIAHEIAHCCCPQGHHTWQWESRANVIYKAFLDQKGLPVDRHLSRITSNAEMGLEMPTKRCESEPKYALVCPKCGVVVSQYKTMCKAVEYPFRWLHSKCHTKLESHTIEWCKENNIKF